MSYKILRLIVKFYIRLKFHIEVIGSENIPMKGPFIIASNHVSNYDPLLLGCLVKPEIHFLAKKELFTIPVLSWILKNLHAIPVDRKNGNVIRPVRHSLTIINNGNVLGIFPEGTRCRNKKRVEPKRGVGFLASKSNTSILPVALVGVDNSKGFRRPLKIIIGSVIDPVESEMSDYMLITKSVMGKIDTMKRFYDTENVKNNREVTASY